MLSGRFAGMAVRPFPLQSTMLLLQVHMAGQEPPPMLQGCRLEDSWWPEEKCRREKRPHYDEKRQVWSSYRCVNTGGFGWFSMRAARLRAGLQGKIVCPGICVPTHGSSCTHAELKLFRCCMWHPPFVLYKLNCKWMHIPRDVLTLRKKKWNILLLTLLQSRTSLRINGQETRLSIKAVPWYIERRRKTWIIELEQRLKASQ